MSNRGAARSCLASELTHGNANARRRRDHLRHRIGKLDMLAVE
jgi:hypothetical protein